MGGLRRCNSLSNVSDLEYKKMKMKRDLNEKAWELIKERMLIRKHRSIFEINYKLHNNEYLYEEKNNFFEYNIEDCMKFFGSRLSQEEMERKRCLQKVKRQILRKELEFLRRKDPTLFTKSTSPKSTIPDQRRR